MITMLLHLGQRFSRSTISVLSVCLYIVFSIIKRFADDQRLMLIPVLFAIVLVAIAGIKIFACYRQRAAITSKQHRWLLVYLLLNTGVLSLSLSYYWQKV